ncbi:DNA ligase [compost metagenome]
MENFIKQAFILFEQIGSTTSRTAKEDYLRQGQNNDVFRFLLYQCYNPFILFYMKKNPKIKAEGKEQGMVERYNSFTHLVYSLSSRDITGNEALEVTKNVLSCCTEQEYKWYLKVLQKDLKIGITDKTINKVFGKDFVPTFSCMLAEKLKKYPKRFVVNPKMDGYRYLGFNYGDGRVEGRSRNGNLIEGYDGIEEALSKLPSGYVYDGEVMDRDGTFSGTQKSAFKKAKGKDGVLHIFDMVPIEEFEAGKGSTPYELRLNRLYGLEGQVEESPYLTLVPFVQSESSLFEGRDTDEVVTELHDSYVMQGYEGAMVKDLDAPYECKKGYAIQKVKKFFTIDLTVVDVEEGKEGTQFEGTLGSLVVELSDKDIKEQLPDGMPCVEGGTFVVKVGSGFKANPGHEYSRDVLWARKEDLINRTIEIKCFGSTLNDDGGHSLRFPIFKKFRDDK